MKIKRIPSCKQPKNVASDSHNHTSTANPAIASFTSKYVGALCFDFNPFDRDVYLIGTDAGQVHKCSCTYNDHVLQTYSNAHKGPVYDVRWSPLHQELFLTGSADWTVKLWLQNHVVPLASFTSSSTPIHGLAWHPTLFSVFCCVDDDFLMIWDFSKQSLDPIVKQFLNSKSVLGHVSNKLTCVIFALNADCLIVGREGGQLNVFKINSTLSEDALSGDYAGENTYIEMNVEKKMQLDKNFVKEALKTLFPLTFCN
ncbi:hypothetical protein HELRODRAFT_107080 [Helobdella robusta]|uniref:Dynein axonemal intermediate chain 4 n=1 Tax=Helobdella robusta TaxID=6412 RepID=T1EE73_HELRO|nr:hypothetical protein HELRODRAFT_107080 [Helobdella robusta]ESN98928.1 hypothetical protein HELRODRAFT_107080 [Helobdella robusta]